MIATVRILLLICAIFTTYVSNAQSVISTIAGLGVSGYSGDGGMAVAACLNRPVAICFDNYGNLVFADAFNHVVRKISSAGIITTIAGNGTAGFSGDGGLATGAQLYVPQGVAYDSASNLYIADGANNRIRKVTPDGKITTIAGSSTAGFFGDGGLAADARLYTPCGLYVSNNKLFIADYSNNRVRQVELSTSIITTIAGNGTIGYAGDGGKAVDGAFEGIIDVFVDHAEHLFIADQWNNVIRKVDLISGIVTTYAGNGTAGYAGDGGFATSAKFQEPVGVYGDKANNVYVADYRNGAIRKIDGGSGVITTIAGGVAGYGGDGGPPLSAKLKCSDVWVDDYGHIFIADYVNHRIREVYDSATVNVTSFGNGEIIIYPNPSSGKFVIECIEKRDYQVEIYNLVGQRVFQSIINNLQTGIDLSKEAAGVYLVHIQIDGKRWIHKIVLGK